MNFQIIGQLASAALIILSVRIVRIRPYVFWYVICPYIPIFSGFNNTMAVYLVFSVDIVCQFYNSITAIMNSQPLYVEKPFWVKSTIYQEEYRKSFDNSLDQVYVILFYFYSILICINAWHLSPGFMIAQTCFTFSIEIVLLEVLHIRFLLISSSIYMGKKSFANLEKRIEEEIDEVIDIFRKNILELTIIVLIRNIVILNLIK